MLKRKYTFISSRGHGFYDRAKKKETCCQPVVLFLFQMTFSSRPVPAPKVWDVAYRQFNCDERPENLSKKSSPYHHLSYKPKFHSTNYQVELSLKKIEISGSRSVCRFLSAEIVKNDSADWLNITFLLFSLSTTPGIRQNSLKIFCHILVKPLSTFRHSDTARSFQDLSFKKWVQLTFTFTNGLARVY